MAVKILRIVGYVPAKWRRERSEVNNGTNHFGRPVNRLQLNDQWEQEEADWAESIKRGTVLDLGIPPP